MIGFDRYRGGRLGLYREALTRVLSADPPAPPAAGRLLGRADIGRVTIGRVGWEIAADGTGGSTVRLWAKVERASLLDRVLLVAGGRCWLTRVFGHAVGNFGRVLEQEGQSAS